MRARAAKRSAPCRAPARDAPGAREQQAEQHGDGGGLAGPVAAEQAQRAAARQHEGQAVHGQHVAVALAQPFRPDRIEPVRAGVRHEAAGTPLLVLYSKCSAVSGCTIGWMAWAAIAASLNPCRISLSLPG